MIRYRDVEMVNRALQICDRYKEHGLYTIVSILAQNRNIRSVGINNYRKTHPNTPQIYKTHIIPTHAEIDCISKWIVKNRKIEDDMTLYVVGYTKSIDNRYVISSLPCPSCMIFVKKYMKRVVYTKNEDDDFRICELLI